MRLKIIISPYFLLIDATDRSKISSDQKRLFLALRLYPLSFFANTPFKGESIMDFWFKRVKSKGHVELINENHLILRAFKRVVDYFSNCSISIPVIHFKIPFLA